MPLLPGEANIGKNIATELAHGKKRAQAIAIALRVAKVKRKAVKQHQEKLEHD